MVAGTTQAVAVTTPPGATRVNPVIALSVRTPYLDRAPTAVQVVVGNVDPGSTITFRIDGSVAWTAVADGEGMLAQTSIPIGLSLGQGSHSLSASTSSNGSASGSFTLNRNPSLLPQERAADVNPVAVPGSTGRFVFQDVLPGGIGSWVMPINPSQMTPPEAARALSDQHTVAPITGQFHLNEGATQAQPWRLQGYCPDAAYDAKLRAYRDLRRRIYVIDHRARAWTCIVLGYSLELRKRKAEDTGVWNDHTGNWSMDLEIVGTNWKVPL